MAGFNLITEATKLFVRRATHRVAKAGEFSANLAAPSVALRLKTQANHRRAADCVKCDRQIALSGSDEICIYSDRALLTRLQDSPTRANIAGIAHRKARNLLK